MVGPLQDATLPQDTVLVNIYTLHTDSNKLWPTWTVHFWETEFIRISSLSEPSKIESEIGVH